MRVLNIILEIITSPFSALLRLNVNTIGINKILKTILILGISLVLLVILILYGYRQYIFK